MRSFSIITVSAASVSLELVPWSVSDDVAIMKPSGRPTPPEASNRLRAGVCSNRLTAALGPNCQTSLPFQPFAGCQGVLASSGSKKVTSW